MAASNLPGTQTKSPVQNVGTQIPGGTLVGRSPGGTAPQAAHSIPIRSIQPVAMYKAPLKAGSGATINNNTITITPGGSAINQLTGDVTAGPGTGSQVATLATVNGGPGSYTLVSLTVNGKGLVTAASTGALTGDVTSTGLATVLATVNSNIGTWNNVTINAKGLATAGSNVAYLTGNQTITLTGYTTGSGATSIATTTGKVKGNTSGSAAAAGDVGEELNAIVLIASEVSINAAANVVTLALTAGDWDVTGELWVDLSTGAATLSGKISAGITTSSAALPSVPSNTTARATVDSTPLTAAQTIEFVIPVGPVQVNTAAGENVFLIGMASVSAGTANGYGKLMARRRS